MRIVSFVNQKGGVGKSTTTFQTARAAVRQGLRVLAVDLDPQGNLTSVATAEPVPPEAVSLADVLSDRTSATVADVAVQGVWDGLLVVPSGGESLAYVNNELVVAGAGRESRLVEALSVTTGYDLVLIDCPPSLDQLTLNGLTGSQAACIVTQPKMFSLSGLANVVATISAVRRHYNPALTIAGVLVNQFEGNTVSGRSWLEEGRAMCVREGIPVLEPPVPKHTVISDATEAGHGLDQWPSPLAKSLAQAYDAHLIALMEGAGR